MFTSKILLFWFSNVCTFESDNKMNLFFGFEMDVFVPFVCKWMSCFSLLVSVGKHYLVIFTHFGKFVVCASFPHFLFWYAKVDSHGCGTSIESPSPLRQVGVSYRALVMEGSQNDGFDL